MTATLDIPTPILRHYRNLRRGYGDGAYPDGQPMPARYAWAVAHASAKGSQLAAESDHDVRGIPTWSYTFGPVEVEVRQEDDDHCDCHEWAEENPRDDGREEIIPEHGHFGLVATATMFGREIAHDSLWGFTWGWPGQDDYAELAYAWETVADGVLDTARDAAANLPAWVVAQLTAWEA